VLAADPTNRPAARQLAVVLSGRSGADLAAWGRAWAVLGPEPAEAAQEPDDRLARAVVLSRCPDPACRAEVIGRLDALVADLPARLPTAVKAREFLAQLLLDAGQPEKASRVAAVSAATGADPAAVALYARALIQSKKTEAAAWQLDRLAALNPGDPREANLRARLAWDRARPVESAAALERAYSVREDTPGAEALGREAFRLLVESGPDANHAAERLGRRLAAKNPACSWMPALALARASRYDEALQLLQTAVKSSAGVEDLRESCQVASRIAVAADDPETLGKVDGVIKAALAAAPNSDEITVMLAMLRHVQTNFEEEARLYQAVLAHRPESVVVLNNLAWALSEGLNKPAESLKHLDALLKIVGRDNQALDTRGMVLARLGRLDEAIHDLEEVIKSEPTAPHHFHLARVYHLAGRADDARRSLELARQAGLTPREVDPAERPELPNLEKALKLATPSAGAGPGPGAPAPDQPARGARAAR